jgi:hypothetical protein
MRTARQQRIHSIEIVPLTHLNFALDNSSERGVWKGDMMRRNECGFYHYRDREGGEECTDSFHVVR